ncbi:MAG: molecular chaperone [Calothrix sp. C42_A2020_038]|nr:molecular chaperone [Calothrix sp. C42_A2020_038]
MLFRQLSRLIVPSVVALTLLGVSSAKAIEITVTPPRMELDMNSKKSRSNSIKITNLSDKPAEIKAYVRNWVMDEKNQLQDAPSSEQSLDQSIVFTPSRFTIPPRSTQTVRFAIRPKVKPTGGEYRAVIYLEEIAPSNASPEMLQTLGRVGVVIYGYAGEVKRIGTVNSVNVDTKSEVIKAIFDVSSQGNAHIRMNGQYSIWRAANYPGAKATQLITVNSKNKLPANVLEVGRIELPPVLPSNRRQLILPFTKKLPPGNYVLDINGDLSGMPVDKGIPFTVPNTNTSTNTPKTKNFSKN